MIYSFGRFELDVDNFCLKCAGELIAVEPQVFDLLAYLISHRDRLVTRQELLDSLWVGKVVSDATLSNHIKMARAVLGDDGDSQQIIKTVRGRGYQFVAEVNEGSIHTGLGQETVSEVNSKPQPSMRVIWGVALSSLLLLLVYTLVYFQKEPAQELAVGPSSIAILPFENRSNLAKDEYFTEGVHHDLLMQVAKIRDIKTISRTSVNLYRNSQKSIPRIANELGVAVVLEGGVQRAGQQIRINVQLVDGVSDKLLWAESYTRALTAENVFAIQTEIASAIADALSAVLSPEEMNALAARPTQNLNALDEYFMAVTQLQKNNNEGFQNAIGHLRAALEIDPNFALAYAVLAQVYLDQIYWAGLAVEQQLALASPLIERALHLEPQLSEAHSALASLQEYQGLYNLAYQSYQHALALKPNNEKVYAALGRFQLWVERDIPSSVTQFTKALSLNPKDNLLKENLVEALIRNREFDKAEQLAADILKESPDFAPAYRALADVEAWKNNDIPKAQILLRHAVDLDPGVPTYAVKLALRFMDIGEKDLALHWLRHSLKTSPNHSSAQFVKGMIFKLEGEEEAAFKAFKKVSKQSPFVNHALYHQLHIGLALQREDEVREFFKLVHPELFLEAPSVNAHNYVNAYLLARLYLDTKRIEPAQFLLERSLYFALKKPIGDWQGEHRNWIARIYSAMGDRKAALNAYQNWVEEGNYRLELYDTAYFPFAVGEQFDRAKDEMLTALNNAKKSLASSIEDNKSYWFP